MSENQTQPLLQVKNLEVCFGRGKSKFKAVQGVSFDVYPGETFGLVGESGSGKTTIGRSIMRIQPPSAGEIIYKNQPVGGRLSRQNDKNLTREIQMIFQDPMSSLNERAKVDYIVGEGLYNNKALSARQRGEKIVEALKEVGLRPEFASRFPHEFSGGQRQRIGIARAIIMEPSFIVADEPISALDVSIRAQILNLLSRLQKERGLTYLFISHDLSVMRFICDRVAALHKGRMVELAPTETLYRRSLHPYTRALLSAIPQPDPKRRKDGAPVVYNPAEAHDYSAQQPHWCEIEPGHFVLANEAELEQYRLRLRQLDAGEKESAE
ncbi:MAG: ATP-binding cassette domain-containing protein [Oscillospiraceae bacterium]